MRSMGPCFTEELVRIYRDAYRAILFYIAVPYRTYITSIYPTYSIKSRAACTYSALAPFDVISKETRPSFFFQREGKKMPVISDGISNPSLSYARWCESAICACAVLCDNALFFFFFKTKFYVVFKHAVGGRWSS